MTTKEKLFLGILLAVAALLIIFKEQVANLWDNLTGARTVNNTIVNPTQTVVQPIYVPVYPKPKPHPSCDQIKGQIDWVKGQLAMNPNPQKKVQLENMLANLNNKYAQLGCGGPPPNNMQM